VSTTVSGRLQRLEVDLGSLVRAGDLIAQVEPRDYELKVQQAAAALAEARAAVGLPTEGGADEIAAEEVSSVKQAKAVLEEATKTLDRTRSLTESRIASASELDSAEAAHKVAQTRYQAAVEDAHARVAALAQRRAELEIARKQLADSSVLAPFDGAIQSRPATVGEFVNAAAPIVTLVKTDPLRLRLEVPERESMLIRAGQTVRLSVEGDTNVYSGRIARLSPALDESNRMLLVEADVPSLGRLRAGLFARVQIVVVESEPGLSVPLNALTTFAGIEKVVTIQDSKALEKNVSTGRKGADWIEILSGLEPGTPVILDPSGLHSGQPVTVGNGSEPPRTSQLQTRVMAGH
jgi:RND family efflux transporter MFP subunit